MKKHPNRKPYTPDSQIKNCLRKLWLWSRERNSAVRSVGNTCCKCGRKGSQAKGKEVTIEVHHINGIDWSGLCSLIRDRLLQTPDKLVCMCKECHAKEHEIERKEKV